VQLLQLVQVQLEQQVLLQLEVQVHRRQLELLLVQLFRKPRLHIQCWRHMLNRSCYHMLNHSQLLLRSKLELEHCSRLEPLRSTLALACSA
jgi:hypothetical protein